MLRSGRLEPPLLPEFVALPAPRGELSAGGGSVLVDGAEGPPIVVPEVDARAVRACGEGALAEMAVDGGLDEVEPPDGAPPCEIVRRDEDPSVARLAAAGAAAGAVEPLRVARA